MTHLHLLLSGLGHFAVTVTSFLGYPGIFVLMVMESMIIPLPSEVVLPFAGFLIHGGQFNFWLALLAATLGSLVGSLISYAMGFYWGNAIIKRWGKYLLLDNEDLEMTEKWFGKRGDLTIFIGRFVPVVRHLISIPAGIAKMDLKKFCLYTVLGAAGWNGILLYVGVVLGRHWDEVRNYSQYFSIAVVILIVLAVIWYIWRHLKKRMRQSDS